MMKTRLHLNEECDYDHTDGASTDFDWAGLDELLGEAEQLSETDYERLSVALRRLLHWMLKGDLGRAGFDRIIARRVVAFCWVLDPALFGGMSLSALARKMRVPVKNLSVHSACASRTFGIRNRGQAHGHNWKPRTEAPP